MMVYALENLWTSYNVNIAHPDPSELQRIEQMCKCMEHKERYIPPSYPNKVPCVALSRCATHPTHFETSNAAAICAPGSNYMTAPKSKCLASFSVLNFQTFRATGIHEFQWIFFSKPLLKFTFPNKDFVEGLG